MNLFKKICIGMLAILLFSISIFAQVDEARLKKWQKVDFSKTLVKKSQLKDFANEDLQAMRGLVFGKRGRIFKERFIQDYLEKQSWYKANPKFDNAILTANERKNIDVIREAEADIHDYVQPGDLRFWETKLIPADKISAATAAEWRVMIAEIEAIHGKRFDDEEWLQKYFDERYWYKANANYSPTVLTEIDRKNLQTLTEARNNERHVSISPGDMDKFQNALLTEELVKGASLQEINMMKNEFFARKGKKFTTPGYQNFFTWQDWYKPIKDQSKVKLSDIEDQNVKLLAALETKIRNSISTEVLTPEILGNLFAEDLRTMRNEIFARHGRVFKSKDLQKYFEAQSWYKPNPDFKDETAKDILTEIEYKNITVLKTVEADATSKFALVEG